jgi:hypothetical protein
MPLSDAEIERFSRQIIVPGFGGAAQERLLRAEITVAGDADAMLGPLLYLSGAGVASIQVETAEGGAAMLAERLRELNPDARVNARGVARRGPVAAFIASEPARALVLDLWTRRRGAPFVVARLDQPARIAVMTAASEAQSYAETILRSPIGRAAESAGFVAMVATTEVLKLAANVGRALPRLIEFDGYEASTTAPKLARRQTATRGKRNQRRRRR